MEFIYEREAVPASHAMPRPSGLNERTARLWFDAAAGSARSERPGAVEGRGITICGGGLKYLPCAWVCINMLRRIGCTLPIELWYLGRHELPEKLEEFLSPLGVECVDGQRVSEQFPSRILNGWELKPYSILHSKFAEVIALDADNVPVVDPTFLFDSPQYVATGAIFWPDYGRLAPARKIWRLTGVEYRDEPEFESGQIMVDKRRCFSALALAMAMNEYSDFWYHHFLGDKETFHFAWRKLGLPYAMPQRGVHSIDHTMCQHDFDGRRIFQHRNMKKWSLYSNPRVWDFCFEEKCLSDLERFRPILRGVLGFAELDSANLAESADRFYDYERVGCDSRTIFLARDWTIGVGAARMERAWTISGSGSDAVLEIHGEDGITARLTREGPGSWRGQWLVHERMPVVIRMHQDNSTLNPRTKPAGHEQSLSPEIILVHPTKA